MMMDEQQYRETPHGKLESPTASQRTMGKIEQLEEKISKLEARNKIQEETIINLTKIIQMKND